MRIFIPEDWIGGGLKPRLSVNEGERGTQRVINPNGLTTIPPSRFKWTHFNASLVLSPELEDTSYT